MACIGRLIYYKPLIHALNKAFQIAEKKGDSADVSFIDDDESEDVPEDNTDKTEK